MKTATFILAGFLLMLTGCASSLKEIKNAEIPFEKRHFSIRVPQGDDWKFNESPTQVYFGKILDKTHTVTAFIEESETVPAFAKAEEFYIFYKTQLSFNNYPDRFKLIKFDSSKAPRYGEYGLKYSRIAEDFKAPNAPGGKSLITKENGYIFLLPEKYGMIHVYYSERGLVEEMIPDFDSSADRFFNGLKIKLHGKYFTEFNKLQEEQIVDTKGKEFNKISGVPLDLDEDQFKKLLSTSSLPILVEFCAPWCEGCCEKTILVEIAKQYEGKVIVVRIDYEKNQFLSDKYGVKDIFPSYFITKDNIIKDKWIIRRDKEWFDKKLKEYLVN